jgi:hypothetical protein
VSNLSCIGFQVQDQSKFVRLLDLLVREAVNDAPADAESRHVRWTDTSGASVAFHVGKAGIECITPYFVAPSPAPALWNVRTHAAADDPDCAHCGGADCDILDSDGGMITRATVQWLHYQPSREWLTTERSFELQVVMFAGHAATYENEQDFYAAQESSAQGLSTAKNPEEKRLRFAAESFLSEGIFAPANARMIDRATAMMAGRIEACHHLSNSLSGKQFVHLRVRTLPGVLEVVVPSVDGTPSVGALCSARGWLVGRPNVVPRNRRSSWGKWFRRA